MNFYIMVKINLQMIRFYELQIVYCITVHFIFALDFETPGTIYTEIIHVAFNKDFTSKIQIFNHITCIHKKRIKRV